MHMQNARSTCRGFTLPTVVVASVAMLAMLLMSFQLSAAASNALRSQYYTQLSNEAAEAGATRAVECLNANGGVQEWSEAKPLQAGTACDGSSLPGCPDGPHCYVVFNDEIRTNFRIGEVTSLTSGGYNFSALGTSGHIRSSDSSVSIASSSTTNFMSNASATPQIAGGGGWKETGHIGIFVSTTGELYGYGWNGEGQITNSGLPETVSIPMKIELPAGVETVKQAKTSGRGASHICIIGDDNAAYCRGEGASMLTARVGWQKMGIPGNLPVVELMTNGYGEDSVCALVSTKEVYCAGSNDYGRLGNGLGATLPGVAFGSSRKFVLPSGVTATELYHTVANTHCAKGSNDILYCAGSGYAGQPGPTWLEYNPTPMDFRLPSMGSVKRSPRDVRSNYHNMINTHVLATDGTIWSRGQRSTGNMGSGSLSGSTGNSVLPDWFGPRGGPVKSRASSSLCMDIRNGSIGRRGLLQAYNCNNTTAQRFFYTADTGALLVPADSDSATAQCVTLADNGEIMLWDCTGNEWQRWSVGADGRIRLPHNGKCLGIRGGVASGNVIEIQTCSSSTSQIFDFTEDAKPYLALISGNHFLCGVRENSARCSGSNTYGQLMNDARSLGGQLDGSACTSTASTYQLQLPPGETIDVDLLINGSGQWQYQVDTLQVITRSGKVYGSGNNTYGKLGHGSTSSKQCSVVQMNLPAGVRALDMSAMDEYSTYVLGSDGNVYATGRNDNGQLGDGTTTNKSQPVRVLLKHQTYFY